MTQTEFSALQSSFPLPDAFSVALIEMFKRVQPGIVQVRTNARGGGTGIIWHEDGRVITNNHVVSFDRANIDVLLADGRELKARVLHRNPQLDLALLKVEGNDLKPLPVGSSARLRVGEWVFAIGHPWGQRWALTAGIVSGMSSVKIAENLTTQYIKSDVGLAPGNSGGPLLNADGEVVGVNAMIFGGDLSVSIPGDVVTNWLTTLSKHRIVLGIEIQKVDLPGDVRAMLQSELATGLLIVGTGARNKQFEDLLVGDILLEVAGKVVSDAATLRLLLAEGEEGKPVSVRLLRSGKIVTTDVATQVVDVLG